MSIFKKALGAFVELEPDAQQVAPTVTKPANYVTTASYDAQMLETLQRTIAARKTPYTALLETASKLEKVIADEPTRLKAAFATIASDGQRTLESVVQAIDVHIADLEGERLRFKKTSDSQHAAKVGSLQTKARLSGSTAEAATNRVKQLQDEIASLQQQAATHAAEAAQAEAEANQAALELDQVTSKFDRTVELLKSNLESRKIQLGSVLR